MGVHDTDVYPAVKQLLGIPEDEPIFILRAQDQCALEAIPVYAQLANDAGAPKQFLAGLGDVAFQFSDWRMKNRDKVKVPD